MLAETIPESEFGYPNSVLDKAVPASEFVQANSVLAETALFFLQASRSFTAPVSPRRYCRLVRCMRHFSPAEASSSCLLIQLSRCSYSSANHPGGLLSVWAFTLRDCCVIMATIGIYTFCCRHLNGSNLQFLFVWRTDKIYFLNSYCRNED